MPKIIGYEAYLCDIPVARKRSDASQSFVSQETVFVDVWCDTGEHGLGYTYTIGSGGSAVLEMVERYLGAEIVGTDPHRPEDLWGRLRERTRATMVGAITALAFAAIDTAVWDLRSRLVEVPLWKLVGGASDRARLYDTDGGWLHLSEGELVANAQAAVGRGFAGVKVKVGKSSVAEDFARLAAVRAAIGADAHLMIDANQGFTRDEARRRAHAFEPLDITWFEEPLPADDVQGHREFARSTSIPVAVGESLYSIGQFREYVEAGAATVLQPDVARIGGITTWLKVAHLAEMANLLLAPHFLMELHLSLVCGVANGMWLEFIPQLEPLTRSTFVIDRGFAIAPSTPGLGIDWDHEAIREARA